MRSRHRVLVQEIPGTLPRCLGYVVWVQLVDELSSSLRDTTVREETEVATFTDDEVLALTAFCTRLMVLAGTRNMTVWIEEDSQRRRDDEIVITVVTQAVQVVRQATQHCLYIY